MDRNQNGSGLALVLFGFIFMAAQDSNASLLSHFRKLGANSKPSQLIVSPAPAPAPASAIDSLSFRNCTSSSKTCTDKTRINITACLISLSNAKNELFLLVQNQGESSVEVNVTTNNTTSQIILIPKHVIEKVNVTGGRGSLIILSAGNNNNNNDDDDTCVVRFEQGKSFFGNFYDYAGHATPLNGVLLLAMSALIFGGTWACCVLGTKERHADGVRYQELEMGRPHAAAESPSGHDGETETGGRWDQGWEDDDWGEIKAVRSPKARQNGDASTTNVVASSSRSSDREGWENTWDD